MELGILADVGGGTTEVAAFCRIVNHGGSEVTGPAFSPDDTRLYLSSQRGPDGSTGYTYEITGPFRQSGGPPPPPPPPPPVTLFVSDAFSRTVSNGWGAADVGGAWALTGGATSNFSVSGGAGRMSVPAGSTRAAVLGGLVERTRSWRRPWRSTRCRRAAAAYVSVVGRRVDAGNDYRVKVRFQSTGVLAVYLARRVNGAETTLVSANSIGFTPGQFVRVKLRVVGDGAHVVGGQGVGRRGEPSLAAWLLEQFDSTAGLQVAGGRRPGALPVQHHHQRSRGQPLRHHHRRVHQPHPRRRHPNKVPLAAFTATATGLGVAFDGTTSSDPDGTVKTWAWTFGDGTNGSGSTTTHTYATGGTYNVGLIVTDDAGATGTTSHQVTVVAPPPNKVPLAAFTATATGLGVAFDGTTSSDPDGTVKTWAWSFGDGTNGSGSTTTHTYATGGTYNVGLIVTDDAGATGTTSQQVTVVAPPPPTLFASDVFSRTVSNGWGAADVGGAWALTGGATNFSVSGGAGRMSVAAGSTRAAAWRSPRRTRSWRRPMAVDKVQTGGGAYVSVVGRRVDAGNDYRVKVRFQSNGVLAVYLARRVNGAETTLVSANSIAFHAGPVRACEAPCRRGRGPRRWGSRCGPTGRASLRRGCSSSSIPPLACRSPAGSPWSTTSRAPPPTVPWSAFSTPSPLRA